MPKRTRDDGRDPDARCLAEQFQGGTGNAAGPELALYRLVRWLLRRRQGSR